ncbi:LysR substrate-binding domain-containing protein [Roseobacter sinensis]|uniref:LysR substrate-binding domain-containing protein n=1 Tax=Roseobacter sinensis TaxID=2931391 RepID=A0ABT3BKT0_9RHOB|nr:LysR substrate-binding domain-containing protein [Roseobacter sp. WL0113]MCV3274180.1 LysR substrate-binding domain-containing protein [Roseobacter sp. WL0113]
MAVLPPLNGLRAFDVAGRRLSFRAAADELGVTQGAVAQQVRQLEAHLGVTLFDRLPKGLALTAVGRSYHVRIEQAFSELRLATAQLKPEPGKVLISVTPTFASKWLIPNLPDFSERHADVDLRILATERVSSFHSDGIDLAVRQGAPPFGAALDAMLLFKQDVIAVAAPALVKGVVRPIPPNLLAQLPKIHDTHDLWPKVLAEAGVTDESSRALRLSQTTLAVDAAISGQGAALVSRFLVANDLSAGHLVALGPSTATGAHDFYLLSRRKAPSNAAVDRVVSWLKSTAARTEPVGGPAQL